MTRMRIIGLVLAMALVGTPLRARADDAANADAQEHYTAGRESYRGGLYGRALEEFERSLVLAASPNTRLYIARTLRELGRWSEAAEQYAATIQEAGARGGRYLATRDAAAVELADVKVRLERATAPAPGPRAEVVEKSDKDKKEAPHVDEAAAPAAARTEVPAGSTERRGGPSTVTWISGGVAVAGTASFAVLYALASNRFGYLEDSCTRLRTAACDDARTTGKAEEIGAYASLGIAAVAAAVTVYSLLVAPASSGGSTSSATAAAGAKAGVPGKEPWTIVF